MRKADEAKLKAVLEALSTWKSDRSITKKETIDKSIRKYQLKKYSSQGRKGRISEKKSNRKIKEVGGLNIKQRKGLRKTKEIKLE